MTVSKNSERLRGNKVPLECFSQRMCRTLIAFAALSFLGSSEDAFGLSACFEDAFPFGGIADGPCQSMAAINFSEASARTRVFT